MTFFTFQTHVFRISKLLLYLILAMQKCFHCDYESSSMSVCGVFFFWVYNHLVTSSLGDHLNFQNSLVKKQTPILAFVLITSFPKNLCENIKQGPIMSEFTSLGRSSLSILVKIRALPKKAFFTT